MNVIGQKKFTVKWRLVEQLIVVNVSSRTALLISVAKEEILGLLPTMQTKMSFRLIKQSCINGQRLSLFFTRLYEPKIKHLE